MQLYALNEKAELVQASFAKAKTNYTCLECENLLRVRKGSFRKAHFFHANHQVKCSQQGKSLTHLALQEYLYNLLPKGEVELEKRFASISRIADVAWLNQKIIFEIQCSPIDDEEVLARNQDYQSLGFETIWILHDKRYNKWRHTLAEKALQNSSCYFTNFTQHGKGIIYDQFEIIQEGVRKVRFSPLPINLAFPFRPDKQSNIVLSAGKKRLFWQLGFYGDLLHCCLDDPSSSYLEKAKLEELKLNSKKNLLQCLLACFTSLKNFYVNWLDRRLEKTVII